MNLTKIYDAHQYHKDLRNIRKHFPATTMCPRSGVPRIALHVQMADGHMMMCYVNYDGNILIPTTNLFTIAIKRNSIEAIEPQRKRAIKLYNQWFKTKSGRVFIEEFLS